MPKKDDCELIINKIPRATPIPDLPANFPKQDDLYLQYLEIENKLRKGLRTRYPSIVKPPPRLPPPKEIPKDNSPPLTTPKPTVEIPISTKGKEKEPVETSGDEDSDEFTDEDEDEPPKAPLPSTSKPADATKEPEPPKEEGTDIENAENAASPEELEAQEREEYRWKYTLLKKKYPNENIPEYSPYTELDVVKSVYDHTVKELYLDQCAKNYKDYLIMGLYGIEYIGCNWLNIDIKGFASYEQKSMQDYDRFLIEFGEKSYSTWGQSIPVEFRILGFLVFKVLLFFVLKSMMVIPPMEASRMAPRGGGETKMRGPSLNMHDIKGGKKEN